MSSATNNHPLPNWAAPAVTLGHDLHEDGVRCERWTCRTCGSAVLRPQGLAYGSAIEEPCR